jgi:very-short-patch-repair endonuclease
VLDNYCAEARLCVEVDGEQHEATKVRDAKRDAYLSDMGVMTIRVPSLDLFDPMHIKTSQWIDRITATCEERTGRKFFEDKKRRSQ